MIGIRNLFNSATFGRVVRESVKYIRYMELVRNPNPSPRPIVLSEKEMKLLADRNFIRLTQEAIKERESKCTESESTGA